ncbi:MAG TPA: OmpA family protein [Stellaceae bacterium]|nr:OmpA family protein [Stellaceae bacterium]
MRNRYLIGAGAVIALALSWGTARAQMFMMPSGQGQFYIGGEGGWTSLGNTSGSVTGPGPLTHFAEKFNDGFNAGGRIGYEWGPWRFEEEFRYQLDHIPSVSPIPVVASEYADGNRYAYAIMTNVIYDFNTGWPITPHIGGGIGAVVQHDAWAVAGGTCADSTDLTFGYQAIAGIRYNINNRFAFDLDYRYLGTTDPTFHFGGGAAEKAGFAGAAFKSEYSSNSILASLTIKFGAPPPPPPPPVAAMPAPPAPPPMVRKVFLVFFDWDKAAITPEGTEIIRRAADAWRAGSPVMIQVTGYTDRSGSPGYNQRLSERRAHNVAVALAGFGVPQTEMMVSGRGENDNRVPTANGVREPQNRRVEIVFS